MSINYSHLPAWLENSRLFRKLFLLKKVYLERNTQTHYAQFGEDIAIARLFDRDYKGFFVDVGCYHPKKYNNTWSLYRSGWRGINVDIDAIKVEAFRMLRPEDVNVVSAVSSQEGEIVYYSNGFYSLSVSMDDQFVASRNTRKYRRKTAHCQPLTKIIDATVYRDRHIDVLSIDTEGHDIEVLKSLDMQRYNPRLIAVEIHLPLLTDIMQSELYNYLIDRGYCMVGWNSLTLLFANPSLQYELQEGTK